MKSLHGRLSVRLLLSLIIVFGLQWLVVNYSIHQVTEDYVISRLEHDADSLLAAVSFGEQGQLHVPETAISTIYHTPYSGHYYLLRNAGFMLRSRSLWDQNMPMEMIETGQSMRYRLEGPEQQALLMLQQGYRKQGHVINIAVAEDMSAVEQDINTFQMQYLGMSLLFLILLIGLQFLGIRKALSPLQNSRRQIEDLIRGRLNTLDENVPTEVRPLIREINHLLELLIRRLSHSRTAIANLAHALKTPLTVLKQLPRQESLPAEAVQQLDTQIATMQSMLERELKLAMLAGSGPSTAGFRPQEDLQDLIAVMEKIYPHIQIAIQHADQGQISRPFDREDIMECLGNLLDNACKWAETTVRVRVDASQGLAVTIEDDGPGCSQEQLEKLGTRGLRLDESVVGHGLGLSICRDIVSYYQGSLEFGRSAELKGLQVRLELVLNQSNRPSTDK